MGRFGAPLSIVIPCTCTAFYIDRTLVTNAEFEKILERDALPSRKTITIFCATGRRARYPEGWENKPVTWVSIEDARAYAAWAGKRLPHEWEWQYAAQSTDGRIYPWGNDWNAQALPPADHGPDHAPARRMWPHFPKGASPFGVLDLVGNVSQWTDEFRDPHTRAAIVRGGAVLSATGIDLVFPANLPFGRTPEIFADVSGPRPLRHDRFSLRSGCATVAGFVVFSLPTSVCSRLDRHRKRTDLQQCSNHNRNRGGQIRAIGLQQFRLRGPSPL